jgi:hypothetical protein
LQQVATVGTKTQGQRLREAKPVVVTGLSRALDQLLGPLSEAGIGKFPPDVGGHHRGGPRADEVDRRRGRFQS